MGQASGLCGIGTPPLWLTSLECRTYLLVIDTAQGYKNEEETGKGIRESGLPREDFYITTKFSGRDELSIPEAFEQSMKKASITHCSIVLYLTRTDLQTLSSWEWVTSTCTSSTTLPMLHPTFRARGRRWRNSRKAG